MLVAIPKIGGPPMRSRRTREERQVIARRVFEALCEHYPDRYIAFIERPGSSEATVPEPIVDSATAADRERMRRRFARPLV
jgi:hypothetical protein